MIKMTLVFLCLSLVIASAYGIKTYNMCSGTRGSQIQTDNGAILLYMYSSDFEGDTCSVTILNSAGGRILITMRNYSIPCTIGALTFEERWVEGYVKQSLCRFSFERLSNIEYVSNYNDITVTFNKTARSSTDIVGFSALVTNFNIADPCKMVYAADTTAFTCKNKRCISQSLHCDGYNNCGDSSDEEQECGHVTKAPIPCIVNQFKCDNGQCIKASLQCNGVVDDCADNSDERGCSDSGSRTATAVGVVTFVLATITMWVAGY